jgi:hypothetical protein
MAQGVGRRRRRQDVEAIGGEVVAERFQGALGGLAHDDKGQSETWETIWNSFVRPAVGGRAILKAGHGGSRAKMAGVGRPTVTPKIQRDRGPRSTD